MQIDTDKEELLSLAQAALSVPPIDGRQPHKSTVLRWMLTGVRGVKLEYIRQGRRICTSRQALARFRERQLQGDERQPDNPESVQAQPPESPRKRSSRIDARALAAERRLAESRLCRNG